ncbi:MAG: N-acetyltransferase [Bacteroidales bacterium]|nr:N-acetyltransferase [Candidatus Latescibacterota bacterium]
MKVRPELEKDFNTIRSITRAAFDNEEEPDLIEAIRESSYYIPELSLVAETGGKVTGYIMFSRINVVGDNGDMEVLSLAPMAVIPDMQNRGIGSRLLRKGIEKCRELGHRIIIVIGHPEFYPRFGFVPARDAGFEVPFDVPDEAFMVTGLVDDALEGVGGMVIFSPPFDGLV